MDAPRVHVEVRRAPSNVWTYLSGFVSGAMLASAIWWLVFLG